MQLTNKTVFITGGAGGMGTAFARALVEKGANVVIADIDETKGTELTETLSKEFGKDKAIFIKCDVSTFPTFQEAFKAAVSKYKQIDIMVNNAGVLEEKDLEKLFHVNLKGVMIGTELALAHMRKDKGGQGGIIVNMASQAGYGPIYFFPAYSASKAGIIGYTRALATVPNLSQQDVRYACICPGLTDTPGFEALSPTAFRQEYHEQAVARISRERMNPMTVAEGLLTLIDDDDSNNALLDVSLEGGIVRKKITVADI